MHPARWQSRRGAVPLPGTLTGSGVTGVAESRREVIATVFRGVQNRLVSGYLLRDVINKLNGIHFFPLPPLRNQTSSV